MMMKRRMSINLTVTGHCLVWTYRWFRKASQTDTHTHAQMHIHVYMYTYTCRHTHWTWNRGVLLFGKNGKKS